MVGNLLKKKNVILVIGDRKKNLINYSVLFAASEPLNEPLNFNYHIRFDEGLAFTALAFDGRDVTLLSSC